VRNIEPTDTEIQYSGDVYFLHFSPLSTSSRFIFLFNFVYAFQRTPLLFDTLLGYQEGKSIVTYLRPLLRTYGQPRLTPTVGQLNAIRK